MEGYKWNYCVYSYKIRPRRYMKPCKYPNCLECPTAVGRMPNCDYARNLSCTYYNCVLCEHADPNDLKIKFGVDTSKRGDKHGNHR